MSYDCQGNNECKNNGTCYQDTSICPKTFLCMCEKCFYGSKCELTTKDFSLSLDVIFGYHIKQLIPFTQQSITVKITAATTIVMLVIGLISGTFSILTFRTKPVVDVGCGIYLLINSILSLSTIIIFTIKYWEFVLFQMNFITNRSFIHFNCLIIDFTLKILLSSNDWLNASVAIERAFTAIQGVTFNKSKSKYLAKRVIPIIFIIILLSYLHDPLSRELFDDDDEERTWCIVNYSSKLKIYDRFINLFHFLTPFVINIISALIIIIQVFRSRLKIQKKLTRKTVLHAEIKRHKHLIISPVILIVLAVPRLILSFLPGCMESPHDSWLYLIGYYISFVPPLLIFVVFVLPSEKYKDEFIAVMKKRCCFS
jgi:hypothetical protein